MAAGFKVAIVNASDVAATLTNYPTYVDLSRLGITTLAEAQSVRVYADEAKTTEWAREIVSTTEMHVKVPSLTSTVEIYVDWDGVSADYGVADTYGRNAVWIDYWAVWHMNGANASTEKRGDSTGNARNLTEFNTPLTPATNQWGDTDGAYNLQGVTGATSSTTLYDYLSMGRPTDSVGLNVPFTISTWFNLQVSDGSTVDYIMRSEYNGPTGQNNFGFEIYNGANQNKISFGYNTSTGTSSHGSGITPTAMVLGDWNHVVGRRRATDYYPVVSLNGSHTVGTTGSGAAYQTQNDNAYVNRRFNSSYTSSQRYATGYWSEARIRLDDVGDDWLTTEYNNQSDEATFWGTWTDAGASSSIKSIDGVLKANIKSFNGVTLA